MYDIQSEIPFPAVPGAGVVREVIPDCEGPMPAWVGVDSFMDVFCARRIDAAKGDAT